MKDLPDSISCLDYSCKCGCGLNTVAPAALLLMVDALEYFEEIHDKKLTPFVNSACRCLLHNETVQLEVNKNYIPFSSKSYHMPDFNGVCYAIDWGIREIKPYQIYEYLDEMYPNCLGLGKYSWGIHSDPRPKRARFGS